MRYFLIAMVILVSLPLSGAVIYEYDGAGRLTRVDYGNGKVIAYRYDNAGNLVGRSSAAALRRRPVRRAEGSPHAAPAAAPAAPSSSTTIEGTMTSSLSPVHPGEVLLEEFMRPLGLPQYRIAKETNVSARRINEIVQGKRAVTADTALRLARFFGTSEMFWLNLQARYDLDASDLLRSRLRMPSQP